MLPSRFLFAKHNIQNINKYLKYVLKMPTNTLCDMKQLIFHKKNNF